MRRYLLFLGLLLIAIPARAAIGLDATSVSGSQTLATYSWNHTVGSGVNRVLYVGCGVNDNVVPPVTFSSITYNGVALTQVNTSSPGAGVRADLWRLIAPATGTLSIAVTLSAAPAFSSQCGAISFTGVNQVTPEDVKGVNSATAAADPATASVTLTGTAANSWYVQCVTGNGSSLTVGDGATSDLNDTARGVAHKGPQSGNVTPSWTVTGGGAGTTQWAINATSIKAAASVGTNVQKTDTLGTVVR